MPMNVKSVAYQARYHRTMADMLRDAGDEAAAVERDRLAAGYESQLTGANRCRSCGRPLTDDHSRETGFGPECRRKAARRRVAA